MYCSKCNKNLMVGKVLCRDCAEDFERVPDESVRLGYYARHPEALAKLLMEAQADTLWFQVCRHDCVDDPDDEIEHCTDENYASCIVRWLLDPIEEVAQDETKS